MKENNKDHHVGGKGHRFEKNKSELKEVIGWREKKDKTGGHCCEKNGRGRRGRIATK